MSFQYYEYFSGLQLFFIRYFGDSDEFAEINFDGNRTEVAVAQRYSPICG